MNKDDKDHEKTSKYFQEALSDFVYDAASGRAIRHLVDTGYTTAQIVQQLNYPTPFAKVRHTVTRYLKETGILLDGLPIPPACLQPVFLKRASPEKLFSTLAQFVTQDGEENSYISCLFGIAPDKMQERFSRLSVLTAREIEYIEGIAWEPKVMYHRLNRRMLEIGVQIAMHSDDVRFYFLKSRQAFLCSRG